LAVVRYLASILTVTLAELTAEFPTEESRGR